MALVPVPTLPAEFHAEPARRALREERYADAISSARSGIAFDEKNPFLWLHLGQAHAALAEGTTNSALAQGSWAAAAQAFERGLQLYPYDEWLMIGYGGALDGLHRFTEADPIYKRATEWNPTSGVIHFLHATHLRLAGRYAEAEAEYRKSIALYYNPAAVTAMEAMSRLRERVPPQ
jgi:tetratricopeptide (TPR) repeat protein